MNNYKVRLNDETTLYLGKSRQRAVEVQDIVRNTLIRSNGTGTVTLIENHTVISRQRVENGSWNAGFVVAA